MRVLIISDTHRNHTLLPAILDNEGPFDMLIHCGDLEGEEEIIFNMTGPECACIMVPGNNDFFSVLPKERAFNIEGFNIWVTHGHNYYVSMDLSVLKDEAKARGMHIAMFGHTHKPVVEYMDGVYLVNPGSLTYPRQSGRQPSYIIMNVKEGFEPEFDIRFINRNI